MFDLVAAGVEGGSKRAIEEEWTLGDVALLMDRWRLSPPLSVTATLIARALGIKFPEKPAEAEPTTTLPNTLDLTSSLEQVVMPGPGQDPGAAARAIRDLMRSRK